MFDPESLNGLRLLVALHPANTDAYADARTAHLHVSRLLADIDDVDEAAIIAVIAASYALSVGVPEPSGPHTLMSALERTLDAKLDYGLVHLALAAATLRAHCSLRHMDKMGTGPDGYHPQHVRDQRRDAATTLRAFRTWERLVPHTDARQNAPHEQPPTTRGSAPP